MDHINVVFILTFAVGMYLTNALYFIYVVYDCLEQDPLKAVELIDRYSLARPSTIADMPIGAIYFARIINSIMVYSLFIGSVISSIKDVWWVGFVHFVAAMVVTRILMQVFFRGGALSAFIHLISWFVGPLSVLVAWYVVYYYYLS